MFKFILFNEMLNCVYDEVIHSNAQLHFYRYYDSAQYCKTPSKVIVSKTIQSFLNKCKKEDSGFVYILKNHQLQYYGKLDRWKFIPYEK